MAVSKDMHFDPSFYSYHIWSGQAFRMQNFHVCLDVSSIENYLVIVLQVVNLKAIMSNYLLCHVHIHKSYIWINKMFYLVRKSFEFGDQ